MPTDAAPASAAYASAHGCAALLLVESLIHTLTANSVLTSAQAVSVAEIALDTHQALIDEHDAPSESSQTATGLLVRLVNSLQTDVPR